MQLCAFGDWLRQPQNAHDPQMQHANAFSDRYGEAAATLNSTLASMDGVGVSEQFETGLEAMLQGVGVCVTSNLSEVHCNTHSTAHADARHALDSLPEDIDTLLGRATADTRGMYHRYAEGAREGGLGVDGTHGLWQRHGHGHLGARCRAGNPFSRRVVCRH